MEFTLSNPQTFPAGTLVKAYQQSNWAQSELPPAGAPKGAATAEGEVASNGSVVLAGLASGTKYFAAGQVGAVWRYVAFKPTAAASSGRIVETGKGVPPAGLARGVLYAQLAASGSPLGLSVGLGSEPPLTFDASGVPADGSVTLAKLAAEVLARIEANNALFKITRPPSGNLLTPPFSQGSSAALGTKEVLLFPGPIDIAVKTTTKAIAVFLEEAGEGAGQQVRLGVYADNGNGTGPVGAPIWDAGAISTVVAGERALEADKVWEPGRYWPALILQGALTKNPKFKTGNFISQPLGLSSFALSAVGLKQEGAGAGALPNVGALAPSNLTSVLIGLRVK